MYQEIDDSFILSDARLKHDIKDLEEDVSYRIIRSLRPKSFNYNGLPQIGFIAQEVLEIDPRAVKKSTFHGPNKELSYDPILSFSYSDLFVHHIAAFQAFVNQQKNNELALETRLYELTQKLENLETHIQRLELNNLILTPQQTRRSTISPSNCCMGSICEKQTHIQ